MEKSHTFELKRENLLNIKDNWRFTELLRGQVKENETEHNDKCFSAHLQLKWSMWTFCCMHSSFWTLRLWSIWSTSDVLFPAEGSSPTNFTIPADVS